MKREVPVKDLQKLYSANDMVKAGCGGCADCCDCCQGMGESVILDPLDVWRLSEGLKQDFVHLMQQYLELNVVDGIILPNLRMAGGGERCCFLNEAGRCSIHPYRPGLCRLFPLGRYYENGSFSYFLQQSECRMKPKTKVKVSKWLDTPEVKKYEGFVLMWHNLLEELQRLFEEQKDEQLQKDAGVYLLNTFYAAPYEDRRGFYGEFGERLLRMKKLLKVLGAK